MATSFACTAWSFWSSFCISGVGTFSCSICLPSASCCLPSSSCCLPRSSCCLPRASICSCMGLIWAMVAGSSITYDLPSRSNQRKSPWATLRALSICFAGAVEPTSGIVNALFSLAGHVGVGVAVVARSRLRRILPIEGPLSAMARAISALTSARACALPTMALPFASISASGTA